MLPAFLLSVVFSSAFADLYTCQKDNSLVLNEINSTFSLNTTQMASNQNCVLSFSIPYSYMAEININATSLLHDDQIIVTVGFGGPLSTNLENLVIQNTAAGSLHIMAPPQDFFVSVTSGSGTTMTLAMDVTIKPLVVEGKPTTNFTTAANQQPNFVQLTEWKESTVIRAQAQNGSKLVLTLAAPTWDDQAFASIFVYDGSGGNFSLIGTVDSLILGPLTRYTSPSDTLILYRAMSSPTTATLVINDYENMKALVNFAMDWSPYNRPDLNYERSFMLDATNGPAALTLLNEPDGSNAIYLTKVEFANTITGPQYTDLVIVTLGGMLRDFNFYGFVVAAYTDSEYSDDSRVPQYFPGTARTFYLGKGKATIYYTSDVSRTKDTEAANGRSGFVMSNNYRFMSLEQNSKEFFLHSLDRNVFSFQYNISLVKPNPDGYLSFSVKDENEEMNNFTWSFNNVTGTQMFNLTALEMTMSIFGGNEPSLGTYIVYKVHSTANFSTDPTTIASTQPTTTLPPPDKFPLLEVLLICLGVFLFLAAIVITSFVLRYQIRRGKLRKFWVIVSGALPIAIKVDEWELGEKQLEILEENELGRGAFAIVFEGRLSGSRPVDRINKTSMKVAVKRLPPRPDLQQTTEFLTEINFMKKLGYHPHILGMIGCLTTSGPPLIVLDFCENGDLLSWVRTMKYSHDEPKLPKQLFSIAWQIADGLCYMKSINLLHRDLAARNVLLTKELVVKVSDFGLSREPGNTDDSETYLPQMYVSRGGRLPIKWMAPESLRDFQFSFKTDIWSYGVLLWEMYTFGDVPFAAVNPTTLLEMLDSGERLPQGGIPLPIYELMSNCWEAEPKKRKTVEKIKETLNEMLRSSCTDYGYLMVSVGDPDDRTP